MESLRERYWQRLSFVQTDFIRSLASEINWNSRLIGIKGARGVGKTTMILQYIKTHYGDSEEALYVNLDNIWFSSHRLYDLADRFVKQGGQHLFLDEVHKYPSWSQEIKNLYDDFPQLQIVFTGSSLLEILNARADLSRRALVYEMQGLSFREYMGMYHKTDLKKITLEEILTNHTAISREVLTRTKPLKYFTDYLRYGYYPFYLETPEQYYPRLEEVVNMILEIELPLLRKMDIAYIQKIRQLLQVVASSAPFIPNINKLSERIGISRQTLISYLYYLAEARLLSTIYKENSGISLLQKPDKIYLDNTNIAYVLASDNTDIGNLRETFIINQLKYKHKVNYIDQGDILVDKKYTLEIDGKKKTNKQIQGIENSYIVADDIEFGYGNKLPLWMFGLLY